LKPVRNVACVVEYHSANFGDITTIPLWAIGRARFDCLSLSIDGLQLKTAVAYRVDIDKSLFSITKNNI